MEAYLHKTLIDVAAPDMTFEELYYNMNDLIIKNGFINLDFLGNLGHSIVKNKSDRVYIEKGNFSIPNSKYRYKREDIYYFDNGRLI